MNISNPKNLLTTLNTIILCLMLFAFNSLSAQTNDLDKFPVEVSPDNFTAREVSHISVFPGCEKINVNDKNATQSCLAKSLNSLLADKLEIFAEKLDEKGIISAVAKLQFVIDKSGRIVEVEALSGGNSELGSASVKAMNEIAKEIKKIQPATLEDGTPVNLVFQLPIRFELQESKIGEFNWDELVLATVVDKNQRFEVRQDKQKNIKVYEIKSGKELFIAKFTTLNEVFQTEPYKSILNLNPDKVLLAEKAVDKVLYRLYYSNENKDFIDAYRVVKGKEELIESFLQSRLEFSTLYLKIVLR